MKISMEDTFCEGKFLGSLDEALNFLIKDLSSGEALEYCADPELTRTLEKIAEKIGTKK